ATPPPYISPLPLHDALPISTTAAIAEDGNGRETTLRRGMGSGSGRKNYPDRDVPSTLLAPAGRPGGPDPARKPRSGDKCAGWRRSEEHTSELQSLTNLVCRL